MLEECKDLLAFKEHFGYENFYNIFNCFYLLSNVPE